MQNAVGELSRKVMTVAARQNINVALFSRKQVKQVFFADGKGSKYGMAEIIAERFSDELSVYLPPMRPAYDNEDPRMDIFDAVACLM
jgi:hypothetical protein